MEREAKEADKPDKCRHPEVPPERRKEKAGQDHGADGDGPPELEMAKEALAGQEGLSQAIYTQRHGSGHLSTHPAAGLVSLFG
jgi:hypothetical protein